MRSSLTIATAVLASFIIACEASGPADPTVAFLRLSIDQKMVEMGVDEEVQLSVTTPAASPISWKSLDTQVAQVSAKGLVAARSVGTTQVVASNGKANDTATVTVHAAVSAVKLSPDSLTTVSGQTAQITLQAYDKNGKLITSGKSSSAKWASSAPSVATVSASGLVQTLSVGTALITADMGGKLDTTLVRVSRVPVATLSVNPSPTATVPIGGAIQLTAVAKDASGAELPDRPITWSSSDTAYVTVTENGSAKARKVGSATITATTEGQTALTTVNAAPAAVASVLVTLASATIATGQTTPATATARDSAGNTITGLAVTWSSGNTSVATVSTLGVVTGVAGGTSDIKATVSGVTGSAAVTVSAPVATVSVNLDSSNLSVGQSTQATAVARDAAGNQMTWLRFTWSSTNSAVATVSNLGVVTAVGGGSTSIVATVDGKSGSAPLTVGGATGATVTVSAPTGSLTVGQTAQATATVKDQSGAVIDAPVTWSSSAPSVATVSSTGLITAVGAGSATIKATSGTVSGSLPMSVVAGSTSTVVLPELPRGYVDSRFVTPSGSTINVPAGGNLQSAIDAAKPGDVIVLQAGATYTGNFVFPVKTGGDATHWVTIRSSAMSQLPAEGSRVNPSYASAMPKIVPWDLPAPVFSTAPGASYYRLVGLEITLPSSATLSYGIVRLGSAGTEQNTLSQVPHHIVLDRVYVHGVSTATVQRCVALNSAWTAVVDSYLSECHAKGFDAQAIGGWNGPGPFKIVNNYLEGSGENIMFGGADPSISQLVPSDMEIRRNHIMKPLSWNGVWSVKNLFELKNGQRVLFEGNVLENNWVDAQSGIAILFQALSDNNTAAWTTVRDVTVRYNVIRNSVGGLSVLSRVAYGSNALMPSQPSARISFQHNLFERMGSGQLFGMYGDLQNASLIHNTAFAGNAALAMDGDPETGFVAKDNVLSHGTYGFFGSGYGEGNTALNHYVPNAVIAGNVLFGGYNPAIYPGGNYFPATANDVGFTSYSSGDYSLSSVSPFKGKASDGTDPGVDFAALRQATSGVVQP